MFSFTRVVVVAHSNRNLKDSRGGGCLIDYYSEKKKLIQTILRL